MGLRLKLKPLSSRDRTTAHGTAALARAELSPFSPIVDSKLPEKFVFLFPKRNWAAAKATLCPGQRRTRARIR